MKKTLLIVVAMLALAGCSEKGINEPAKEPIAVKKEVKEEPVSVSPFTGEATEEGNHQYFSVMIENSPNARPQTGLTSADIVYEMKTEGNISRYLAFFHDEIPKIIGPVRSSRHYYITVAEEYNSPYIHFGASTYAYKYLRSSEIQIPHIDGITQEAYFFRDSTRKAPHNAYLKTETLDDFSKETPVNEHVVFGENSMQNGTSAREITYQYNEFTHIKYVYDENKKVYLRYQEGKAHVDRETEEQIAVKNVLFQFVDHESIDNDAKGRIDVDLLGEGKLLYISEGKRIEGTWKKETNGASTIYYDEEGKILQLNRGNLWIQVVETNDSVQVTE